MAIDDILLAEPRGFCAGVDRAIEIVERALAKFGAPIYVRHEIVHNTFVVNDLKAKGAIFIEDLAGVPPGSTLVFSAHGVSKAIQQEARERGFDIFDATCPLVTKVHIEVAKLAALMAAELDLDARKAKRAGLLHDIGKVAEENLEQPHAIVGWSCAGATRSTRTSATPSARTTTRCRWRP